MEFTPEWFDLSSRAWLANKKRSGYSYTYKCAVEECKNKVKENALNCKHHEGQGIVLRGIVKSHRQALAHPPHPMVGQMSHPMVGRVTRSMTRINPKLIMQPN